MSANIPDIKTIIQMGIDPKTGLPIKMANSKEDLKDNIKKLLRVKDEQQAINRYKWYNLPDGLDSALLERILYYKYQGMFFYMEANQKFYFLPYALEGEIDVYGRYTGVTPLPFNGTSQDKDKAKPWIIGLKKNPIYGCKWDDLKLDDMINGCVLLCDYSKQISQTGIPRQILNDSLLEVQSEFIPFMRTALQNQSGVQAVRVNNQDEYQNVAILNNQMNGAALSAERYLPVTGTLDFQELVQDKALPTAEYMAAFESVDNFRLSLLGINNIGEFQKGQYVNNQQASLGLGSEGLVMQDGLANRQTFCDIVNSIWGLGIACELSEQLAGDTNGDGFIMDEQDQSGVPGEQDIGGTM